MKINTIDDCLIALGSKNSFIENAHEHVSSFTSSGNKAFDTLRNILIFLENNNVVEHFNEDKPDNMVSQKGY